MIDQDLLDRMEAEAGPNQLDLAGSLRVAPGMANSYARRGVKKRHIKVCQVQARRYGYYLTPGGFLGGVSRFMAEEHPSAPSVFDVYRTLLGEGDRKRV